MSIRTSITVECGTEACVSIGLVSPEIVSRTGFFRSFSLQCESESMLLPDAWSIDNEIESLTCCGCVVCGDETIEASLPAILCA